MNFFKKIVSRAPSREELEHTMHAFSKRERILFFGLLITLAVSAIALLGMIQNSFMIERPEYGGKVTEGIVGTPRFINPVIELSDPDKDMTSLVYSGLMRKLPDGTLVPDVAAEYEISKDGLMYTFTLREGAVFHDGEPLTTDDIIYTINLVKDPVIKSPKKLAWDGVTVTRIDERIVTFSLKQPFASFLSQNMTLGILPKHLWQGVTPEQFNFSDYNIHAVGSGPYMIREVARRQSGIIESIELRSFRKFALGRPNIRTMKFVFFANEKELLSALREGKIRQASAITPENARELETSGYAIETTVLPRIFGLFFNQNQATIFTDKQIIRAFNLAIDKERIVNEVLWGYGAAIDSPMPASGTAVPEHASADDRLAEARAILEKAGWKPNEDGILAKTSGKETRTLSFTIATGDTADLRDTAEIIRSDLAKLGVDVVINVFEVGTLNQTIIRPREYDALLFGQIVNSESDLFAFWHSSRRNDPGLNIALYTNAKTDKLLEDALVTIDDEARREKYASFEEEIRKDSPAVFLYSPSFVYVLDKNVKNAAIDHITTGKERFAGVHEWYVHTEKVWSIFERNEQ